jgi:hypothetical protein
VPPAAVGWDHEFEAAFLQRRVSCEPDFRDLGCRNVGLPLPITYHRVAAADLVLVQDRVRETVERLVAEHEPQKRAGSRFDAV